MTRLDDEQIERYSRQLILAEVGPRGQERLGAARVAVVGAGVAAERAVAYLAAAGVGWIATDAALHAVTDAAQPDLTMAALGATREESLDAAIVSDVAIDDVTAALRAWHERAATVCWIAGGRAGGSPPCPRCAAAALPPADAVPRELAALRDALLGTVVATEVVKALLAIGVPLAGRGLGYDPTTATITSLDIASRADCACRTTIREWR